MNSVFTPKNIPLALAFILPLALSSLSAAILVEESFLIGTDPSSGEYADGTSVNDYGAGLPTVTGFAGNWVGSAGVSETGTLTYSDGSGSIANSGGKIRMSTNNQRIGRAFSTGFDGSTSGTYYLGFLYQQQTTDAGYRSFALYDGSISSSDRVFNVFADGSSAGVLNVNNSLGGGSGSSVSLGADSIDANVNFFVFEFNMSTDDLSDTVSLYMNPNLASGPDAGSLIYTDSDLNITFDSIGLERFSSSSSNQIMYLDEIRMSQSFNEVSTVPVPEPTTSALLIGLTVLTLVSVRRVKA